MTRTEVDELTAWLRFTGFAYEGELGTPSVPCWFHGPVRVAVEPAAVAIYVFNGPEPRESGALLWQARYDNAPSTVVASAVDHAANQALARLLPE